MINIHIQAQTPMELTAKLAELANHFSSMRPVPTVDARREELPLPKIKNKKVAKVTTSATEDVVVNEEKSVIDVAEVKAATVSNITIDDCKTAMQTLMETDGKGIDAVRKVIASFGVEKISDVKEALYSDFIVACAKEAKV
jgi:hypothetical protein